MTQRENYYNGKWHRDPHLCAIGKYQAQTTEDIERGELLAWLRKTAGKEVEEGEETEAEEE